MYVDASKTVLLQTARAVVYNPQGSQSSLEVRQQERGPQPLPPLRIQIRQESKVETNTQQLPFYLELPILIVVIASRLIPLARARL